MKAITSTSISLCILALSTISSATDLKFTGLDLPGSLSGTIQINGGSSENVGVGRLTFTDGSSTLKSFCSNAISLLDGNFHTYTRTVLDLSLNTGLSYAGRVIANGFNSATDVDRQAGLQLAVWSALYDNGAAFDANGANFKVSGISASALSFASSYYADGASAVSPNVQVIRYVATESGAQDQLTIEAVPEPASLITLGCALVGLARRRRK